MKTIIRCNRCQNKEHFLKILLMLLFLVITSCNIRCKKIGKNKIDKMIIIENSKKTISSNYEFIGNTLLHDYRGIIRYYFEKYQKDTCITEKYDNSKLVDKFEGISEIGDINKDKKKDSVFILPPLNQCENGQSYYFSDTIFPRIITESNCCHTKYLFIIDDIDEDGISEIGLYYTSCVSKYKSLYVYSLKNDEWKQIGHCIYDLDYSSENTNYCKYIKKTGRNTFEMLEITDLTKDKSKIGKKNWLKFKME